MSFFAGLASGFNSALEKNRQLTAQQDEARATRENAALLHLTTSDDPEIASAAMAGLLQQGQGKPLKGLRGFFNETAGNPALPTIRALISAGKPQQTEPGPTTMNQGPAAAMPPGSSAAMVPGSPPEPGGPPMSLAAVHDALPQAPGRSTTVPRQVFMPPVEKARALEQAQQEGRLKGIFSGIGASGVGTGASPMGAGIRDAAVMHALGIQPYHTTDVSGDVHTIAGGMEIGAPIKGAGKPVAAESAILAQAQNLQALHPELSAEDALKQARSAAATTTQNTQATAANRATTTGAAAAVAPALNQARLASLRQRVINEVAQLPGIQMKAEQQQRALNGQLTAAEAAHTAATFLANHPGATSDDFNEMVGALTGGIAGSTPPAAAPGAAAPGPKPGLPPGKDLYKPNAQEQSSLDTIEAAKPMMQRVRDLLKGHETENTWGNTYQGVKAEVQSMAGHNPTNPTYAQLDPLIQHLKVFALGPYLHGIRNGAFVKAVSDNTPSLTDTPARIIQKLDNLDQNFKDIEAAIGSSKGKAGAGGAGGGGSAQATAAPGPEWTMVNGVLYHNGKPY